MRTVLVITRKVGESIVITTPQGEVIEVDLHRLRPNRAKLAIIADRSFKIMRKEISGDPTAAAGPQKPSSDAPETLPVAETKKERG